MCPLRDWQLPEEPGGAQARAERGSATAEPMAGTAGRDFLLPSRDISAWAGLFSSSPRVPGAVAGH